MEEKEKKVIDKIISVTNETKVPDSLQPEQIEQLLHEDGKTKKRKKWKRNYTYGLAAACAVIIVGAVTFTMERNGQTNLSENQQVREPKSMEEMDSQIVTAKNYEEIYKYMEAIHADRITEEAEYSVENGTTKSAETSDFASADKQMAAGGLSHSDTNVRQEGVDEGDYVKTDGQYMYILKDSAREIAVIDLGKTEMEEIATIELDTNAQVSEFYLADNKLIALGTENVTKKSKTLVNGEEGNVFIENAKAITYDISNPKEPQKVGSVTQSGRYDSSRVVGNYIYIFSQFYADMGNGKDDIEAYIPKVQDDMMLEKNIYMPAIQKANMYMVITSVDISSPNKIVDSKAVFSYQDAFYVSNDNIYIYGNVFEETSSSNKTAIRKISYKDGQLKAISQCKIKGYINDSFSIDEYDGNLRVVTTVSESINRPVPRWYESLEDIASMKNGVDTNALYILDRQLKMLGSIEGLAKDEKVYSARFMGNTGYFVTFRQIDPLFSVDLSDPQNPKIIGELKIPGFSEYLHFYQDGLLLGIGQDVDADGIASNGVKLSMFDIKDPSNVKEVHKYVMEGSYSTDAFHDYKAVLIDGAKNITGFSTYGEQEIYYLFSYDKKNGFICNMQVKVNGNSYHTTRGIYVDDRLYVVKGDIIEVYNLNDFQKISDLILK